MTITKIFLTVNSPLRSITKHINDVLVVTMFKITEDMCNINKYECVNCAFSINCEHRGSIQMQNEYRIFR